MLERVYHTLRGAAQIFPLTNLGFCPKRLDHPSFPPLKVGTPTSKDQTFSYFYFLAHFPFLPHLPYLIFLPTKDIFCQSDFNQATSQFFNLLVIWNVNCWWKFFNRNLFRSLGIGGLGASFFSVPVVEEDERKKWSSIYSSFNYFLESIFIWKSIHMHEIAVIQSHNTARMMSDLSICTGIEKVHGSLFLHLPSPRGQLKIRFFHDHQQKIKFFLYHQLKNQHIPSLQQFISQKGTLPRNHK